MERPALTVLSASETRVLVPVEVLSVAFRCFHVPQNGVYVRPSAASKQAIKLIFPEKASDLDRQSIPNSIYTHHSVNHQYCSPFDSVHKDYSSQGLHASVLHVMNRLASICAFIRAISVWSRMSWIFSFASFAFLILSSTFALG